MSTYGLDNKDILKLDKGPSSNVVTIIPDSVETDRIALGPALVTNNNPGVIPYRETTSGHLKAVTVSPPGAWADGTLTVPTASTLQTLFEDWRHNNDQRVEPIELESTGMKSSGGIIPPPPFTYQFSRAAEFIDFQFGTVVVRNTQQYLAGTTYLVQVRTTAMEHPKTPVLITQVAPAIPASPGGWPDLCNMPCGVLPSRTPQHFNIWFTPGAALDRGNELWFHWFIPFRSTPFIFDDSSPVDPVLPF
jgi:hypothetical protein